jgi:Secretion system C-terminal sorting domain
MKNLLSLRNNYHLIILLGLFSNNKLQAQTKWINVIDTNKITHVRALQSNGITLLGLNRTVNFDTNDVDIDLLVSTINETNGKPTKYKKYFTSHSTTILRFINPNNDFLIVNPIDSCFYFVGSSRDSLTKIFPFICKLDKDGEMNYLNYFGDTNYIRTFPVCLTIINQNRFAVCSVVDSIHAYWGQTQRISLSILDSLGTLINKVDYPINIGYNFVKGMQKDDQNNLYILGACLADIPGPIEDSSPWYYLIKTDSLGNMIQYKDLPHMWNFSQFGHINKISESGSPLRFVTVTGKHATDERSVIKGIFHNNIVLSFINGNLDMYRRINLHTKAYSSICNAKYIGNGKILLSGSKCQEGFELISLDPQPEPYYIGWLALIDTNGNFIWDRTYEVPDSNFAYFEFVSVDKASGSIYASGNIETRLPPINETGLIIKVDSNGCLDTNFCYPLGIREITKIPDAAIQLYPNPARNNITLLLNDAQYIGGQASIYTTEGKLVARLNKVAQKQVIDVQGYAVGNYYLQYSVGDWRGGVMFRVE